MTPIIVIHFNAVDLSQMLKASFRSLEFLQGFPDHGEGNSQSVGNRTGGQGIENIVISRNGEFHVVNVNTPVSNGETGSPAVVVPDVECSPGPSHPPSVGDRFPWKWPGRHDFP